ncbi:sn-glycerol-1-phosphate dehydrogenase [Oceaniovalibus sp. ACAM 378]|uniref:sn-glycerol-1-phosphate dehydrogenase n=1 Tax=Oceaniovalibus sp. ACAM 378 TaxID=2599923 RepID=UPI0011D85EDF|nr:sn-glycerol-1-phosphate dehydrogenase [Oceaniovalibus sp. ACAM 378]TYB90785.1 sn-glycerol-1-phosphate dehydrogenase [Oceaniovalibus sp. ACAM 378]
MNRDAIATATANSPSVAEVLIGRGMLVQAGALFTRTFAGKTAMLFADDLGWAAAGPATEASLNAAGITTSRHILRADPRPKPTVELADTFRDMLATGDAVPVSIGSGVINDVVKHAAFSLDRPYLCVATAASMDGYTSAGAPLSQGGFKMTIQCRPARALLADLDVISAAPPEMTGWGYGDLAGKVPAGADWMVADALGIEPIDDIAWPMVQHPLRGWLSEPERVAAGDPAAIEGLFTGLTLVGFAMEAHGTSRPASGADHQIAHLWEMEGLALNGERVSHGACVAVGTVTVMRLWDWLLTRDIGALDIDRAVAMAPGMEAKARMIDDAFGPGEVAQRAKAETAAKHIDPPALAARLKRLQQVWAGLAPRLCRQLQGADEMIAHLSAAGAPHDAAQIGVGPAHLHRTTANARFLRSRYTLLDLLDETGLLTGAIDATQGPASQDKAG